MHPLLLHQIADDRVVGRRRSDPPRPAHRRRGRHRTSTRLRAGVGGLLISVGTRVSGTRTGPVALPRTPT